MKNTRSKQNSFKSIIRKYNEGEISFGEMLKRMALKPTVRNTIIIISLAAALSTVKDFDIKGIIADKDKTSQTIDTTEEVLEQIVIYVPIVKGDTLNEISSRFGLTAEEVAKYNGIADPNKIIAGTQICIPLPLETRMDTVETYEVKKDETIDSICEDKKITFDEFILLNPGVTSVKEGDKITIVKETRVKEYRQYIVRENDTVESICKKFDMDVQHFLNINNLTEGADIYPTDAVVVLTEEPFYVSYEVKKDETITEVAEMFKVSADEIMLINGITEVIPGEVIVVPTDKVPEEKKILGLF